MCIFENQCGYAVIDEEKKYNGPTGKFKDIQGIQAYAGRDFFLPDRENAERGCRDI